MTDMLGWRQDGVVTGVAMSRLRNLRADRSATTDTPPKPPVTTAAELEAMVRGLPKHSAEVHLQVETLDLVRVLTLADPEITVGRLVLTVAAWQRPLDRWVGRLGPVAHVLSYSTRYPHPNREPVGHQGRRRPGAIDQRLDVPRPATVGITLTEPVALAEVARGVYPLLGVDRRQHGYGVVELGTAELPASALSLLPGRTAPGLPGPPSTHLEGLGLSRAEIGLVGSEKTLESLRAGADDPELTLVRQPVLVHSSGHLAVAERLELPVVDLNLHNPIGRRYAFARSEWTLALTADDGTLAFTPVETRATKPNAGPELRARKRAEKPEHWSRPTSASLSGCEVHRVREIEAIDLGGLHATNRDDEMAQYRRLAELAATGTILHSLPPSYTLVDDILGPTLADLLRQPYRPTTGLVRDLRSVPQRREAMHRFGGFFELARYADQQGHRLLPTVSVLLSSMRPTRVADVLTALAAQHYPHVEIAVALHGVEGPVDDTFAKAAQASGASVFHYERSTPFGSVLADLARRTSGDLVVKIDDDDVYGPRVIEDLVLAHLYSNADVVGKTTEYLYFEDLDHTAHRRFATERYHTQVAGGAMMLSRAVLNEIGGWRPTPHSTDRSILIRVGNGGGIGYRTNSLGYVYIRHSEGHTWKQADSLLLRQAPEQWPRFMNEIIEA